MSKPKVPQAIQPPAYTADAGHTWHSADALPEATSITLPAEGGSYTREPGGQPPPQPSPDRGGSESQPAKE